MLYQGLPVYSLEITGEDTGISAVSIVDEPAIMNNFLKFSEEKQVMLSKDNEKQDLYGPVLIPGQLIYRRGGEDGYYVTFSAETIEKLQKKYFRTGTNFSMSLDHDGNPIQAYVFESFLKDSANGISPKQWPELDDGTWFIRAHIEDPGVWERIKAEELHGFSIECIMGAVELSKHEQKQEQFDQEERQVEKKHWMDELLNMADQM